MKFNLILITLLFVSSSVFAQRYIEDSKRRAYNTFTYQKNQIVDIFSDSFDNGNVNNWNMGTPGKSKGEIKNGSYYFTANWSSEDNFTYQEVDLDTSKDFQIEITIKPESETHYVTVRFGANDKSSLQFFYRTRNGECRTSEYDNEHNREKTYYSNWLSGEGVVNPKGANKITIRHIDNGYYYFVNGVFITEAYYYKPLPWYGPKIGFVIDNLTSGHTVSISEFKVSYLQ